MIREASAMTVRQNLGDLLNEVQYRNGRVLITKAGKPVAALVDIALFEGSMGSGLYNCIMKTGTRGT